MHDPDELSGDLSDLLNGETLEEKLAMLDVDIPLTDVYASLDTCGIELEDVDRYLVTQHLRVAYIKGHIDGLAKFG